MSHVAVWPVVHPVCEYDLASDPVHQYYDDTLDHPAVTVPEFNYRFQLPDEASPHLWPHNAVSFGFIRFLPNVDQAVFPPPQGSMCLRFQYGLQQYENVHYAFLYTHPHPNLNCDNCSKKEWTCLHHEYEYPSIRTGIWPGDATGSVVALACYCCRMNDTIAKCGNAGVSLLDPDAAKFELDKRALGRIENARDQFRSSLSEYRTSSSTTAPVLPYEHIQPLRPASGITTPRALRTARRAARRITSDLQQTPLDEDDLAILDTDEEVELSPIQPRRNQGGKRIEATERGKAMAEGLPLFDLSTSLKVLEHEITKALNETTTRIQADHHLYQLRIQQTVDAQKKEGKEHKASLDMTIQDLAACRNEKSKLLREMAKLREELQGERGERLKMAKALEDDKRRNKALIAQAASPGSPSSHHTITPATTIISSSKIAPNPNSPIADFKPTTNLLEDMQLRCEKYKRDAEAAEEELAKVEDDRRKRELDLKTEIYRLEKLVYEKDTELRLMKRKRID